MKSSCSNSTVILLMSRQTQTDTKFIKKWFENSRFQTREASDIFQAIEEISDFTDFSRPEVVLLEVDSVSSDFPVLRQLTACTSGETDVPFMALTENGKRSEYADCYEGNLSQLAARLEQIFPTNYDLRAAA